MGCPCFDPAEEPMLPPSSPIMNPDTPVLAPQENYQEIPTIPITPLGPLKNSKS
jgi:hypothetical protein